MNLKNIVTKIKAAGFEDCHIAFGWTEFEDAQIDIVPGIFLQVGADYMSVSKWHADGEGTANWPMREEGEFDQVLDDLQAAIKH